MLTNEYLKRVYEGLEKRNGNEPEFLQAVREVLESIQPVVAIPSPIQKLESLHFIIKSVFNS